MQQVFERVDAPDHPAPVVVDSPHSGECSPPDFGHAVSPERLRMTVDAYVDELFQSAPHHGATFIRALFPRTYIDPNRSLDDIDDSMLCEPWPDPITPSLKVKQGIGLIARRDLYGQVYRRKLSVAEVRGRIEGYYRPYHTALREAIDDCHGAFGSVWHINCHSMRTLGTLRSHGRGPRAEICVGDRDGETADPEFRELVVETLREMGYRVTVNEPYKGVELVRRYSDPARGRHSVQIEIGRALYMNENLVEKHTGFDRVRTHMGRLTAAVCRYARDKVEEGLAARAAE